MRTVNLPLGIKKDSFENTHLSQPNPMYDEQFSEFTFLTSPKTKKGQGA
jgi:hypothetical protein